jgi:hypothetical protein
MDLTNVRSSIRHWLTVPRGRGKSAFRRRQLPMTIGLATAFAAVLSKHGLLLYAAEKGMNA